MFPTNRPMRTILNWTEVFRIDNSNVTHEFHTPRAFANKIPKSEQNQTHLRLSLWALYSIAVPVGRLSTWARSAMNKQKPSSQKYEITWNMRTRLNVSLILLVTAWSHAVRFQMLQKKVWGKTYRMNNLSHCITSVCPPGTWWRQQRRRSPPPPWTAHQAWPVPSSPSTENWDLSRRMPVCFSRVNVTFPQPNNPLATEFVCLVLPHWFDPCKNKDSTGEYSSYSCHSANPPILKRWKSLWLASSPGFTWKCFLFTELFEPSRWQ